LDLTETSEALAGAGERLVTQLQLGYRGGRVRCHTVAKVKQRAALIIIVKTQRLSTQNAEED
jgi:hypothetical protein